MTQAFYMDAVRCTMLHLGRAALDAENDNDVQAVMDHMYERAKVNTVV